ncbi:MAG: hypothetical protein ACFCVD_17340 [Nodosilinea sp.]
MKGLTLVGLLATMALAGAMMAQRLKPDPTPATPALTQPIDRANGAAETMQQEAEALQNTLNQEP